VPAEERRRLAELVRREGTTWPDRFRGRGTGEDGAPAAPAPGNDASDPEEVQTTLF
jgi:hypothetical protein